MDGIYLKSKTESENDFDMPLFNKELSGKEFDRKVREKSNKRPLEKVSVLPAKKKSRYRRKIRLKRYRNRTEFCAEYKL